MIFKNQTDFESAALTLLALNAGVVYGGLILTQTAQHYEIREPSGAGYHVLGSWVKASPLSAIFAVQEFCKRTGVSQ